MAINNDNDFKRALDELAPEQQRLVAAMFADSVLPLCQDVRVTGAVAAVQRPGVVDVELAALYQATKTASVESYTQCGQETDWGAQAGHFVAKAAMDCVKPVGPGVNCAWDAAMDARMARTCETIARGQGTENREAENQYEILEQFLNP